MVVLTKGCQRIVAILTVLSAFGRFVSSAIATGVPDDDDTAEGERAATIYTQPAMAHAPPPNASLAIGNRLFHTAPQNYPEYRADDSWWMGSPRLLFDL